MTRVETILYQEPGIRLTSSELTIGRFAYRRADIQAIRLVEFRPKRNPTFMVFTIGALVLSCFLFNNIYGVLLVAIAMFPSLMWIIRPRLHYALEVEAAGEATRPILSAIQTDVARISAALNQALEKGALDAGSDFQVLQDPVQEGYEPGREQAGFVRTIPRQCPKCDEPLTLDKLDWRDLNTGFCPQCRSQVAVTWRKA
jgi:hypothetical protein